MSCQRGVAFFLGLPIYLPHILRRFEYDFTILNLWVFKNHNFLIMLHTFNYCCLTIILRFEDWVDWLAEKKAKFEH